MVDFFSSLYIHIPFCIKKCKYCDFYSLIHESSLENLFIESLTKEMELTGEISHCLETVYIGGGTPNCLSPKALEKILSKLTKIYKISENLEFTVELNPALLNDEVINILKDFGVNRLSIGVQSFIDSELRILGRLHSSKEAVNTIESLYEAGFDNLSLDFIYGIPGQTFESFLNSLSIALSLNVKHISIYELSLSKGTELQREIEKGRFKPSDEELIEKLYLIGSELLEKGGLYKYEISNFSKKSYECKHNLAYWKRKPYLGLGPSAHSLIEDRRFHNPSDLFSYSEKLKANQLAWRLDKVLNKEDKIIESLILGLRLKEGIEIGSNCLLNFFKKFKEIGLVKVDEKKIKLTDRGMLLSNEIFVQVISHIENCPLCKEELKDLFLQIGTVFD